MPSSDPHRADPPHELLRGIRGDTTRAQAILFDLDGTLIDTVDLIRESFRHATRSVLGYAVPDEVTMRNVGQPLWVQYRDIAPGSADELLRAHHEFTLAEHDTYAREYPRTRETLRELRRRGLPIAVVTSKGTVAARHGIDAFGLGEYLDAVVTADDVERHKPDPYPLQFAATLLGVELGYCIYVGDSPHDMQAAVAGGAIAAAALWGAFPPDELIVPGTAFALSRISDLLAVLDGEVAPFAV